MRERTGVSKPQRSWCLWRVGAERQSASIPRVPSPGGQAESLPRDAISPNLRSDSLHDARWKITISQTTGQSFKKQPSISDSFLHRKQTKYIATSSQATKNLCLMPDAIPPYTHHAQKGTTKQSGAPIPDPFSLNFRAESIRVRIISF